MKKLLLSLPLCVALITATITSKSPVEPQNGPAVSAEEAKAAKQRLAGAAFQEFYSFPGTSNKDIQEFYSFEVDKSETPEA